MLIHAKRFVRGLLIVAVCLTAPLWAPFYLIYSLGDERDQDAHGW